MFHNSCLQSAIPRAHLESQHAPLGTILGLLAFPHLGEEEREGGDKEAVKARPAGVDLAVRGLRTWGVGGCGWVGSGEDAGAW